MIRIASVRTQFNTVIRIPLYPNLFDSVFSKKDATPICNLENSEIELSIEDVCRMAKALQHEMAIDSSLEPTPAKYRIHKILKGES